MEMIEATGNSVEDAIKKGCAELKVTPNEVMIEVLEEPNTGIFGFGAREARVRLVLIGGRKAASEAPAAAKEAGGRKRGTGRKKSAGGRKREAGGRQSSADEGADVAEELQEVPEAELGEDAVVGKAVLEEFLEKMQIDGRIRAYLVEDEADGEEPHWMLNITGENVSRLIGRRGETLASLQYIVRLICSRRLQRRANLVVDAGGYKLGRSNRLRGLAKRMAKQAVQQGRTIALEPMQANERRIIHLTLRGRGDVMTRSVGEGRTRKVTIVPK